MQDGEFALIARFAHHLTGAGDDAAVVDIGDTRVVVAADALVRDRHWSDALSSPADVGWKAVAVNVSDLAAMGDVMPRAALVTLLLPAGLPAGYVERLYDGAAEAAGRWGLQLVGGDTCSAPALALSVTVLGELRGQPVWRSGAAAGDRVVVVGPLGAAAAALAQHAAGRAPAPALLAAHRRPRPLLAAGAALAAHGATALIDVSDGLGADLAHICAASGVAARLRWAQLPVGEGVAAVADALGHDPVALVCGGGEDYALVATVPAGRAEAAARAAAQADDTVAAVVGEILPAVSGSDPVVELVMELLGGSDRRGITELGWDHFAGAPGPDSDHGTIADDGGQEDANR